MVDGRVRPKGGETVPESTKTQSDQLEERNAQILKVATRIFARKGFRNTDVQDIADEAGVGKGTVYRHFGAKKELFLAAVDKGTRDLTETILERTASCTDPMEFLQVGLREYFKFFDKNQDLVEIFIQERSEFRGESKATYFTYRDNNISVVEETLKRGMEMGAFRPINVKRTAEIICDLAYGTVIAGLMKGDREKLVSRTEDILKVYLDGIRNQ